MAIIALPSQLPSWQLLLAALILFPISLFLCFYLYVTPNTLKDPRRRHLPPGPRGLPFIGSYLSLRDAESVRHKAVAWKARYGDIFYTKIGGSDWIWLSSPKIVKELMDKRSAIYSSRPPNPLAQDVASAGRRQLFMAYGSRYRTVRKIAHNLLNITISTSYQPVQDLESKQLMSDLLHDPAHFYDHNRRYSASVITTVTYGKRISTWDDPLARNIYAVMNNLQLFATPGAWLVDSFPSIRHLPQALFGSWRAFGEKCHKHDSAIYLGLWEGLKADVAAGTAKPCFCRDFLESEPEKLGLDNLQAAYQAGGLVEAGAETTSAYLNTMLSLLVRHPEVARRAQEELDRVVGGERMPWFGDEERLPYLRAVIKETMRTTPPNKIGIHHATSEDDWYEGMFVPKGSVVILNWWATNNDPSIWDSPEEFRPERFLSYDLPAASYINVADPYERDHFSYGAGRRVCPGVHIAEKSMFLNLSRILWAFEVGQGKEVPTGAFEPGWMTIPKPFECSLRVRQGPYRKVIEREWREARKGIVN